MELKEALQQLRNAEKKGFDQSVDLIVNLKGIDLKRDNVSAIVTLPHKVKDKKVCAFLTKRSSAIDTITQPEFSKYKEKKDLKKLVKKYDFFIAVAPLMPSVATNFGKALGPAGKMPSPQLGVIAQETESAINAVLERIEKSIKVRAKEPSLKLVIGKESMKDEQIIDNVKTAYNAIVSALPTKKENVKSVMVKLTMSKPLKVEIK